MDHEGWHLIDDAAAVGWREYEFARGAYATTMFFRGPDGLIVLSPATGLTARDHDALEELGPVRALVASNDHHHFGQVPWRARHPDAESFAPEGCLAPLRAKAGGVPFRSLAELPMPRSVSWTEAAGFKTGETLLSVTTPRGAIVFVGDVLANIARMPGPPLRWLFTLTGSAPGFRPFRLANFAFVRDRAAVRERLLAMVDAAPPYRIVPAHGPPVQGEDLAERARAALRAL